MRGPLARLLAWAAIAFGAAVALPGALGPGNAIAASAESRYSLANGCFALRSLAPDGSLVKTGSSYRATARSARSGEPFRLQATALGSYLLYDADAKFLAVDALGRVTAAREPSQAADWIVQKTARGFTLRNRKTGKPLATTRARNVRSAPDPGRFGFEATQGCRRYPEVEVGASGAPAKGRTAYGEVSGLIDAHMHHMAFEFLGGRAHCGRPWHPYGAPSALVDCPDHQPNGAGAVLENTISYGGPAGTHNTDGWPTFRGWPHHASLTHEQSYYKWLERSWRGGQRIFVNLLVENEVLCEIYPLKKNSCNEMQSARLQAKRMHQLENYIDAQNGGPGKGWFRIVRDPFEARRVINDGKLAVIMGMETSKPFNCGRTRLGATCTQAEIDRQIDSFHRLGVRQLELVNKFDNAFTGVAGDSGSTGTITNTGNFYDTGSFWRMESCEDPRYHDHSPTGPSYPHNEDMLIANGLEEFGSGNTPAYPDGPLCNRLRFSGLGRHALDRIMDKGMIFDPDHMGVYARQDALREVERRRYSGIVSSHSWSTLDALPRIYALGGFITPYAGGAQEFVDKWKRVRGYFRGRQYFGFGYGADMNGFGSQGGPRNGPNPVSYPFRSFDGKVSLSRQRSGTKAFDINRDGVAHYGLYPDWIADIKNAAGSQGGTLMREMGRGAEAYLQMWERAEGVEPVTCRVWSSDFSASGLGERVRLGDAPASLLRRAGQPVRRTGGWQWCAVRARGAEPNYAGVGAAFDSNSRVALVVSAMPGTEAAGVAPGDPAGRVPRGATRAGEGVFVHEAGSGARFVYVVRDGRVRHVGVATASAAGDPARLRGLLTRAGAR